MAKTVKSEKVCLLRIDVHEASPEAFLRLYSMSDPWAGAAKERQKVLFFVQPQTAIYLDRVWGLVGSERPSQCSLLQPSTDFRNGPGQARGLINLSGSVWRTAWSRMGAARIVELPLFV